MNLFDSLINTFFFLGKAPVAPGTIGSVGALVVWWFLPISPFAMIYLLFCIFCLSYLTISSTLINTGEEDPQHIVIDEVIGMWISLLPLSLYSTSGNFKNLFLAILAFLLFRLFDIMKPSIIYRLQFIRGPLGVLLDDVLAGVFSGLIITGILSIC